MKKTMMIPVLVLLASGCLEGSPVFTLKEVANPSSIQTSGGRLVVVQDATAFIYSLKNRGLITRFGKKGDGPGEFKTDPSFDLLLNVKPVENALFFFTPYKMAYFNAEGKLLMEKKLTFFTLNIAPVGNHYVLKKYSQQGNIPQYTICLADKNLKIVKKFTTLNYSYKPGIMEPIQEYCDFRTAAGTIYILNGVKGLNFAIYDREGKKSGEASYPFTREELKDDHKRLTREWLERKSWYKLIPPQYKKKTRYPALLPVCKNFLVDRHRIYVHTYKKVGQNTEFLILTPLRDRRMEKVLLPVHDLNIQEYLPYAIEGDKFYYLVENGEEEWELRVKEIL